MKKNTLAILGHDYNKTTSIFNKLVLNCKAKNDQEHIKINIIINNKLLEKSNLDIFKIIKQLEKTDATYLMVDFDNKDIIEFIEDNTNLILIKDINEVFNLYEEHLL